MKMKSLKLLAFLLVAVFLFSVIGVAQNKTVKLGADSFILGAHMRIAKEKGFFEEVGIDSKVLTFSYGVDTVNAILTGETHIGVSMDFAMLTRLTTHKLRILATMIEPEPGWHKLATSKEIENAQDLAGKRMGVASGTLQEFVTYKHLQTKGVPKEKVEFKSFTSLYEIVAALGKKQVDAAWVWAQGVEKAKEFNHVHILYDDSEAGHRSYGFVVASKEFVEENPEIAMKFTQVMIKTTDWIKNNMEEAAKIISGQLGAPEDTVLQEMKRENYCYRFNQAHQDHLTTLLDWMYETEVIEEEIDITNHLALSPLREVDPEKVDL